MNDLERHNSPYFAFFTEFDSFAETNAPRSEVSAIAEHHVEVSIKNDESRFPFSQSRGNGSVRGIFRNGNGNGNCYTRMGGDVNRKPLHCALAVWPTD